jgi:uncharacterized membrane protein YjfL (UPF0719 family)
MINGVQALVFLVLAFALCWVGKLGFGLFHPGTRVDREVTARDNVAFAVPLGAYYLAILVVISAPLGGVTAPAGAGSRGDLAHDAVVVLLSGLLAIALLNVASLVTLTFRFRGLDLHREVLERGNVAAGIVLAGSHVANALLVVGALGDEGGIGPALVFWLYAQVLLELAALVFLRGVRYDAGREIRKDNRAAALMVAGVLVAMGNVLRLAITGPFEGWAPGFIAATGYASIGLGLLFAVRWLTDWLLLPGVTIREEVLEQAVPNVGVGWIEAVFYVGASVLIGASL